MKVTAKSEEVKILWLTQSFSIKYVFVHAFWFQMETSHLFFGFYWPWEWRHKVLKSLYCIHQQEFRLYLWTFYSLVIIRKPLFKLENLAMLWLPIPFGQPCRHLSESFVYTSREKRPNRETRHLNLIYFILSRDVNFCEWKVAARRDDELQISIFGLNNYLPSIQNHCSTYILLRCRINSLHPLPCRIVCFKV